MESQIFPAVQNIWWNLYLPLPIIVKGRNFKFEDHSFLTEKQQFNFHGSQMVKNFCKTQHSFNKK